MRYCLEWASMQSPKRAWRWGAFTANIGPRLVVAKSRLMRRPKLTGFAQWDAVLLLLFAFLCASCRARDHVAPANEPRIGAQGSLPSHTCVADRRVDAHEQSALGSRLRDILEKLGGPRKLPLASDPSELSEIGVSERVDQTLTLSFASAEAPARYDQLCGKLIVPVLITAQFSTQEQLRGTATLTNADNSMELVSIGIGPGDSFPVLLSATLTPKDADVRLEIADKPSRAVRFSTLCGTPVEPTVQHLFGIGVDSVIANTKLGQFFCMSPHGSHKVPVSIEVQSLKLRDHEAQACRAHPAADPKFKLAVEFTSEWAPALKHAVGVITKDASGSLMRITVSGGVKNANVLSSVLPCAVDDERVNFEFTSEIRGSATSLSRRSTLDFSFSCEDVAVSCSTY